MITRRKSKLLEQMKIREKKQIQLNPIVYLPRTKSIQSSSQILYHCHYCRAKFTQNSLYFKHIIDKHTNKQNAQKYVCDACNKVFTKKYLLDIHYQTVHLVKTRFKCERCRTKFKSKFCLKRHTSVGCMSEYRCVDCKKLCHSEENLLKHIKNRHVNIGSVAHKCQDCNKCYKNRSSLAHHRNRLH